MPNDLLTAPRQALASAPPFALRVDPATQVCAARCSVPSKPTRIARAASLWLSCSVVGAAQATAPALKPHADHA
jgi:hypothetical protein